jgi:hypothetical protein
MNLGKTNRLTTISTNTKSEQFFVGLMVEQKAKSLFPHRSRSVGWLLLPQTQFSLRERKMIFCFVVLSSLKGSHFNRTVCLGYRFSFVRLSRLLRWTRNCENDDLYYLNNSSCDLLTTRVYSSSIFKYSKLPNHYVAKFQILHSHTSNCQICIDFFKYASINVANI